MICSDMSCLSGKMFLFLFKTKRQTSVNNVKQIQLTVAFKLLQRCTRNYYFVQKVIAFTQ